MTALNIFSLLLCGKKNVKVSHGLVAVETVGINRGKLYIAILYERGIPALLISLPYPSLFSKRLTAGLT